MLSAEVKYTTAAKAAENLEYKDFAWVDFAEYENITEFKKEFGNQYYISDDVTIENGVLNIPEGATFAWIDANGVFANFLDNSNLGFNVEMMVKTDFVGDGFISVISIYYGRLMKEIIEDYQIGFVNQINVSYLKLVCEVLFQYTNPIGIKHLLSKKGYKSMNLLLPLTKISSINNTFDLL
jgi:hypothetical protein